MKATVISSAAICCALFLGGCSAKKEAAQTDGVPVIAPKYKMMVGEDRGQTLQATVFRMSGPYAGNVAVTLNDDGTLAYYPDPSDLKAGSAPAELTDGWYLNRQGLGPNSVFTRFTFGEYMALPAPPSQKEITEAVIPGARVIEFKQIPVAASEALSDPSICLEYLK